MSSQRELFMRHLAQTTDFPMALEVSRAEGSYVFDPSGKAYLDLISGISVSSLGHGHPAVKQALREQLDRHLHVMVYGEMVQSPQVELATLLAKHLPAHLSSSFLVNSGSEAIEGALKLAKRVTGRFEVVACHDSYHGSSAGALSLSSSRDFRQNFRPLLPGVSHIRFGHEQDLELIAERHAAVFIETVQGEAGVRQAKPAYWQALRARCTEVGCLLVLDEIQAGMGRTGTLWGFQHYGIEPDVLVLAKGLGGGMPIGAFVSSQERMAAFRNDPILGHISTFGGHPMSAAAAAATLGYIIDHQLPQKVAEQSKDWFADLRNLPVEEVRGIGYLAALELGSFDRVQAVLKKALALGVVSDWFLFCNTALRLAPPLTVTKGELAEATDKLRQAIEGSAV